MKFRELKEGAKFFLNYTATCGEVRTANYRKTGESLAKCLEGPRWIEGKVRSISKECEVNK